MAELVERAAGLQGLWRPTRADRIIGAEEGKRSTKTYIRTEKGAILLSLIKNHAESLTRSIQELHEAETGKWLSVEEAIRIYPGVRAWRNVHQELVEHMASQEGFSLKIVASLEKLERGNEDHPESSVGADKAGAKSG